MAGSPEKPGNSTPRPTRRGVLLGTIALLGGGVAAAQWFNIGASVDAGSLSVTDAHRAALAKEIVLIDIRRPDEWARTGVGEGAYPIDMRDAAFETRLLALVAQNRDAPIALICARGVRSRGLTRKLTAAGFTRILDVPEGMLGSGAGPGWIKTGLPAIRN